MAKQIFVNLPIKDLKKTKDFFSALGFTFNQQFSDDKAACMIIGENIYAMLLTEPFYQTFTSKQVADARKTSEVILAVSADSREEVDTIIEKAVRAGGSETREAQDHGWMYGRSFEDVDGHLWEVIYTDINALGGAKPQ